MAEYVGLQAQAPDVMGRLSQILTIRQQQAEAQSAEQSARQRKNIAAYDWNKHLGPDGTLDVESFASDPVAPAIFGDQYVNYLQNAATAKQQQLTQKQTLVGLRTEQRKAFAEMMNALRSDKDVSQDTDAGRQKLNDEFIKYGQIYGDDVLPVLEAYAPGLQKVPKGRLSDALKAITLQAMSADAQVSAQLPQYASTGARLTNINPNVVGSPPDIALQLPPNTTIVTDANGRQYQLNTQNNTVAPVGTGGRGGGVAPSAPPTAPTFTQPVPQQKELEEHISTVRQADADYGTNRHVNEEILRLSADTATGPGTKTWHNVIGRITGIGGGDQIADFQKIGAYLDRQAALSAQQMGLPDTNAGLQTAAQLSGTTDYTPEALQTKVKLTDAMVEGAHQYRKGLDKVIGTGPNQDLSRLQEYRAQWADNFDPNVFLVENALRRGDDKELAKLKKELGPKGMAALKQKSENLEKLERGELLQ